MAANNVLAKMAVIISANAAEFNRSLKSTENNLAKFIGHINKVTGVLGVAFGVQQLGSFAVNMSRVAGEADGVRRAFDRLPNSVRLMDQLKEATGGTVSELDLMKRSVQASNFDIELASLPKLLEFASVRAQQTGQSVDYLVDSIVTGIGRKSKLILDNLGISAVQLSQKLKGIGTEAASVGDVARAVGEIASESLAKSGGMAETTSTRMQKLNAEWANFIEFAGTASNKVGIMDEGLSAMIKTLENVTRFLRSDASSALTDYLKLVTFIPRKTLDGINAFLEWRNAANSLEGKVKKFNETFSKTPFAGILSDTKEFKDALADIEKTAEQSGKKLILFRDEAGKAVLVIKPFSETVKNLIGSEEKIISTYDSLTEKLKELNEQFQQTDTNDKKSLANTGVQILAIQKQIKVLDDLRKAKEDALQGKFQFLPDLEAEGSTNFELRNEQAASGAKAFSEQLNAVATSAEFAGGALIQLQNTTGETTKKINENTVGMGQSIAALAIDIASAVGAASTGAKQMGQEILRSIGGFMQQFGAALIITGIGEQAFKSFKGMIPAGIALVAAGSALVQSAKNSRPDLSSGGGESASRSSSSGSFNRDGFEILVGGEWRIRGADLVYIFNRQNQLNGRTKG